MQQTKYHTKTLAIRLLLLLWFFSKDIHSCFWRLRGEVQLFVYRICYFTIKLLHFISSLQGRADSWNRNDWNVFICHDILSEPIVLAFGYRQVSSPEQVDMQHGCCKTRTPGDRGLYKVFLEIVKYIHEHRTEGCIIRMLQWIMIQHQRRI